MSDDSSSQNSSGEEDFKSELHKKNLKQSRVNKQKPEVVDFLPALSVLDDDVNDQDVDEKNSLPKIKEEISDQELAPSPEVMLASCENGIVDHVVQILDKEPSLINCRDEDGYSPLHRASYNGHTNVVRILLQRGADVQARTGDGWQPLHCACRWGEYLQYTGCCLTVIRPSSAKHKACTTGAAYSLSLLFAFHLRWGWEGGVGNKYPFGLEFWVGLHVFPRG